MKIGFLIKAALSNTLMSSLQRGNVYVKGAQEADKQHFRSAFMKRLGHIEPDYTFFNVNDETHVATIRNFADSLSAEFADLLRGRHLRIGVAQKGVNLYLKYLWSLDRITEPPHCPIDSIVLRAIRDNQTRWTRIDDIETYSAIIRRCRERAGDQSLSQWEYNLWNREA